MKAPGYVVVHSWADVRALSATPIFPLSPNIGKETLPLILFVSLSLCGSISLP